MLIRSAEQDISRVLFTEKAIAARAEQLGAELTETIGAELTETIGAKSTGVVRLIKDLDNNIAGRHVVIVEDIIDSGLTMQYLKQLFSARSPASVTTVSFLDKCSRHDPSLRTDYCGFPIADEFVVGYGLDYANFYRNLPYIGILKPECYQ